MLRTQHSDSNRRTRTFLIRLVLPLMIVLTGCSESVPTSAISDPLLGPRPDHASKQGVPFRLAASGVFVRQVLAPDFGPPNFGKSTFDNRCSEPSDYVVEFSISGHATHMGSLSGNMEHCGLIDFQTGLSTDRDGVLVLTAANGDMLRGSYTSSALGGGRFAGSAAFDGGTGRFANATGEASFQGTTDRPTATIPSLEFEGWIDYAASDVHSSKAD